MAEPIALDPSLRVRSLSWAPPGAQPGPVPMIRQQPQASLTASPGTPLQGQQVQPQTGVPPKVSPPPTTAPSERLETAEGAQKVGEPVAWLGTAATVAEPFSAVAKGASAVLGGFSATVDTGIESVHLAQAGTAYRAARAQIETTKQHAERYQQAFAAYSDQYTLYENEKKKLADPVGPKDQAASRGARAQSFAATAERPADKGFASFLQARDKLVERRAALTTLALHPDTQTHAEAVDDQARAQQALTDHSLGLTDAVGKTALTGVGPVLGLVGGATAAMAVTVTGGALVGLAGAAAAGLGLWHLLKTRPDRDQIAQDARARRVNTSNAEIVDKVAGHTHQQRTSERKGNVLSMAVGGLGLALGALAIGATLATGIGAIVLGSLAIGAGVAAAGVALGQYVAKRAAGKTIDQQRKEASTQIALDRDPNNPKPLTAQDQLKMAKDNPFYAIDLMRQDLVGADPHKVAEATAYLKDVTGLTEAEMMQAQTLARSTDPAHWDQANQLLARHLLHT